MGLDWERIPSISNAFRIAHYPLCEFAYDDIVVQSPEAHLEGRLSALSVDPMSQFRPHFGWMGHVELPT